MGVTQSYDFLIFSNDLKLVVFPVIMAEIQPVFTVSVLQLVTLKIKVFV